MDKTKIKRKSFLLLSGASLVGAFTFLKSPMEIFKSKVIAATKESSSIKFKENPHSVKRKNNS